MLNRTALAILLFSLLVAFGAYLLVPTISEHQKTNHELQQANRKLLEHKEENQKLRSEIQMLNSDARTIERVARDKFGYVMPNETVYDFTKPLPAPKPRIQ